LEKQYRFFEKLKKSFFPEKMNYRCEKGFCVDCRRRGGTCVFPDGSRWPNKFALGCEHCPMNSLAVASTVNQQFKSFEHRTNEIEALSIFNARTKVPTSYQGSFSIVPVIRKHPQETREFFVTKTLEILEANHETWFASVHPGIQNQCLPVVLMTRRMLMTATVARVILLMLGNCLIDPLEVFNGLVYDERFKM
jgi:hypothetical protein